MNLQYRFYYEHAWKHLQSAWPRILVWTAFWVLVECLLTLGPTVFAVKTFFDAMLIGSSDPFSRIMGFGILGTLLMFVYHAFRNYSFFGIAYLTADDPEFPWIETGLSGFLHPVRALGVAIPIEVIAWIMGAALMGVSFLASLSSSTFSFILIVTAALIAIFFLLIGFSMAWFARFKDDSLSSLNAIRDSLDFMHGKRIAISLILAPVLLLIVGIGGGGVFSFVKWHEPEILEYRLATHTLNLIEANEEANGNLFENAESSYMTAKERDRLKRLLAYDTFTRPTPEFDGDVKSYRSELAKYGLAYEEFMARQEGHELSQSALEYRERPLNANRWGMLFWFCMILEIGLVALLNVLLLQIYREMNATRPEDVVSKEKTRSAAPTFLRRPPKTLPKPDEPQTVDATNDDKRPVPPKEQETPQARPSSIDPGFTLKF